ncbi:MAG: cupin domain-containing protein, partial [SAR324 cluster bacterium]|nr:cupin domain-containing protein [SAR324 cluster bacterium]
MTSELSPEIRQVEIVLPCNEIGKTLSFFTDRLGFRLHSIFPADDPSIALISNLGFRIRLDRNATGAAGSLRLICDNPGSIAEGALSLTAPNGTRIELLAADPALVIPPMQSSLVINQIKECDQWHTGRAGMLYRDLIPDRQGGRFIASHIRILEGGPVPDYVHFHKIRFQMIYCYKGWVRVVYEDQGEPFVLQAGDCVLQPPEIRHQVLECSPGMEVIEIGCPAEHLTGVDHDLQLPNATLNRKRSFGEPSQQFVRHEAKKAQWQPWRFVGFDSRDIGISSATGGLADVQVARLSE